MKRKRGRSVRNNKNVVGEPEELVQAPHSFVIHKGIPGGHILELTKDFRKVMEPFTATSLKERKKNTIKDFVSVAGLFHVSHLSIFSRTEMGIYLKVCRLPRGPTLTFKIRNFSLARDVVSSLKKQAVTERAFKHSPLIVLNSFSGEGMHMKLMASMFQNMFPTINLTTVDLNTIRRCVLLSYNPTTKLIDFRHYTIKVTPVGISKGVKKVVQGKIPNLSRCTDIDEFFTKTGMLSESEFEDDPNNHVTLSQKLTSRGNIELGKSSIRLSEVGPRMTLDLIKIEDNLLEGEVIYHNFLHKTEEEKLEIENKIKAKRKLKEKRKKIQEQNKRNKEEMKQHLKEKSLKGMQGKSETDQLLKKSSQEANRDAPVQEDDDREYYRQELGEEPDKDLFTGTASSGVKRPKFHVGFKYKKPRLEKEDNDVKSSRPSKKTGFKTNIRSSKLGQKPGFKANSKFRRDKNKVDKTNSSNRDFRPIGGKLKVKKKK